MSAHDWGLGDKIRRLSKAFPAEVLALVDDAQGGRCCVACERANLKTPEDEPLELDHKQPLSRGGDNHWSNLRWLCRGHNRSRKAISGMPAAQPPWARRQRRP